MRALTIGLFIVVVVLAMIVLSQLVDINNMIGEWQIEAEPEQNIETPTLVPTETPQATLTPTSNPTLVSIQQETVLLDVELEQLLRETNQVLAQYGIDAIDSLDQLQPIIDTTIGETKAVLENLNDTYVELTGQIAQIEAEIVVLSTQSAQVQAEAQGLAESRDADTLASARINSYRFSQPLYQYLVGNQLPDNEINIIWQSDNPPVVTAIDQHPRLREGLNVVEVGALVRYCDTSFRLIHFGQTNLGIKYEQIDHISYTVARDRFGFDGAQAHSFDLIALVMLRENQLEFLEFMDLPTGYAIREFIVFNLNRSQYCAVDASHQPIAPWDYSDRVSQINTDLLQDNFMSHILGPIAVFDLR